MYSDRLRGQGTKMQLSQTSKKIFTLLRHKLRKRSVTRHSHALIHKEMESYIDMFAPLRRQPVLIVHGKVDSTCPYGRNLFQLLFVAIKNSILCLVCILCLYSPCVFIVSDIQGFTSNTNRNVSSYLRPEENTTVIWPRALLPYAGPASSAKLRLLLFMHTEVVNFAVRQDIRDTWLASQKEDLTLQRPTSDVVGPSENVSLVFILGRPDDPDLWSRVQKESNEFGDLLVCDFVDSYLNLTIKTVMILKFLVDNDVRASYVSKIDDDCYVNIPVLLRYLAMIERGTNARNLSLLMMGRSYPLSQPIRWSSLFSENKKWVMPNWLYPEELYPPYLSGGASYVFRPSQATCLYREALLTPLLPLEDVFVSGLCARACGIKHLGNDNLFRAEHSVLCSLNKNNFAVAHSIKGLALRQLHWRLRDQRREAATKDQLKDRDKLEETSWNEAAAASLFYYSC